MIFYEYNLVRIFEIVMVFFNFSILRILPLKLRSFLNNGGPFISFNQIINL